MAVPGLQDRPQVAWSRFELDNGLRVVVHENRRAPLVAVNLWYCVGAKDEQPGQTGFAHLFEHLMFGGSRHLPGPYLSRLGEMGARVVNGTTSHDRTNYFQVVPTGSLEAAMFAESDRMGHFLDALSEETLAQQKGVVLNEKRQTEGAPYGHVNRHLLRLLYPPEHPYAHPVIGSEDDIARATLDDVKAWFSRYYGPGNAVLVLAGDIDAARARELADRWFGHIAPGPRLHRMLRWLPPPPQGRRALLEDAAPQPRLLMAWPMPPAGEADATRLSIAARLLAGGPDSPLVQRLVRESGLASDVAVSASAQMLAGVFLVTVTLQPGHDPACAERLVRDELRRLATEGPDDGALERVKVQSQAGLIHLQADLAGLSDTLAMNEVFFGQPDYFLDELDAITALAGGEVAQALQRWTAGDPAVLLVQPRGEQRATQPGMDRSAPPMIDLARPQPLPPRHEARLANGLRVLLVERHELPLVQARLLVPGGARLEPRAQMGLAEMAGVLMQRGAGGRDAAALQREQQRHGAAFGVGVALDQAHAGLTAFRSRLQPSLALWADVLLRPDFAPAEIDRVRQELVQAIAPSLASASGIVGWHLPGLMYGPGHAYARLPGGLPQTLQAVGRGDLERFHRQAFHPGDATLLVAGDVTPDELLPLLQDTLGATGPAAADRLLAPVGPARPAPPGVYLVDLPGATQTLLVAASLLPPWSRIDPLAFQILDQNLAGGFSSRLNLALRERLHWTYGVRSEVFQTLHQRLWATVAPVQADRSADSMRAIVAEMRRLVSDPLDAADLAQFRDSTLLRMPSRFQSLGSVLGALETMVVHGLDESHWQRQDERLHTVTPEDITALAARLLRPEQLVWIVVGDRRRIGPEIEQGEFGPCEVLPAADDRAYLAGGSPPTR